MKGNIKPNPSNKKGRVLRDSCLILFFLLLSLVLILVVKCSQEVGGEVIVAVNGDEIGRYSLAVDGQYSLNNGSNLLIIENGRAKMIDANCPDKLCIKEGWVKYTGQCITCLPNKLTVTVVGGDSSVEIVI